MFGGGGGSDDRPSVLDQISGALGNDDPKRLKDRECDVCGPVDGSVVRADTHPDYQYLCRTCANEPSNWPEPDDESGGGLW